MALDGARLSGRDSTLHFPRSPEREEGKGMAERRPQTPQCAPEVSPFVKTLALSSAKEEERLVNARGVEGTRKRRGGWWTGVVNATGTKVYIDYENFASAF